jgi:predicted acylesterase/phospholipase RssA
MDKTKEKYKRLVLSGGSIKGIAYIGVLRYFEENKDHFSKIEEFVGTSIGAFMSLLIVLNYSSKELKELFWDLDFNSFKDFSVGALLENFGLDNGLKLEGMIKRVIVNKKLNPELSLSQLQNVTGKSLVCCATNLNGKKTKYFDAYSDPNFPVFLAVRASMSIPMIFAPVPYNGHLLVDGALTNDIPVSYRNPLNFKTLCICLDSDESEVDHINGIENYIHLVVKTFLKSISSNNKNLAESLGITLVEVKTKIVTSTDFSLSIDEKNSLYNAGYFSVKNKLENSLI